MSRCQPVAELIHSFDLVVVTSLLVELIMMHLIAHYLTTIGTLCLASYDTDVLHVFLRCLVAATTQVLAVLSSLWLSIASRGSANCLQLLWLDKSIDWLNTAHS